MRIRPTGAIEPFGVPSFRNLWFASMICNMGVAVQGLTAAWLMIELTSGDATLVALVQSAASLPLVILSLPAGALADLYSRRLVMMCAQGASLLFTLGLLVLVFDHVAGPWSLLALTFLIGSGFAITNPAWHASVRQQVGASLLERAVLLNAIGFNLARSFGPAVGGLVLAVGGTPVAIAVVAGSYLPILSALYIWKPVETASALPHEPFATAIESGLRYVWFSPSLRSLVVRTTAFAVSGSSIWSLTPIIAHERLNGSPATLGFLLAAFGLGAFAGALTRAKYRSFRRSRLFALCTLVYGAASAVLGTDTYFWLSPIAMALAGAAWVVAISGVTVAIQIHAARWVVGRVISILQVAVFLGLALGSAFWGAWTERFGLGEAMAASGLMMAASLLLDRSFPVVSNDTVALHPARDIVDDDFALDDNPGGRLATRIAYRVAPGRDPEFRRLMAILGQIRRRDGARRWHLTQSYGDRDVWIEFFDASNRNAELRRASRMTLDDARIEEQLRTLLLESPKIDRSTES